MKQRSIVMEQIEGDDKECHKMRNIDPENNVVEGFYLCLENPELGFATRFREYPQLTDTRRDSRPIRSHSPRSLHSYSTQHTRRSKQMDPCSGERGVRGFTAPRPSGARDAPGKQHPSPHGSSYTYNCVWLTCRAFFPNPELRDLHYRLVHGSTYCCICATHYPSRIALAEHCVKKHPKNTSSFRILECVFCHCEYSLTRQCGCESRAGASPRSPSFFEERERMREQANNAWREKVNSAWSEAEQARPRRGQWTEYRDDTPRGEARSARTERSERRDRDRADEKSRPSGPRPQARAEQSEKHKNTSDRDRADEKPRSGRSHTRESAPPPRDHQQLPKPQLQNEPPAPPDHYAMLGVSRSATQSEILKAAKKMRIQTHPDKFSGHKLAPGEMAKVVEHSKNVGLAADVLSDPTARRKYDGELTAWRAMHKSSASQPTPTNRTSKDFGRYRDATTSYKSDSEDSEDDKGSSRRTSKPRPTHSRDNRDPSPPRRSESSITTPGPKRTHTDFHRRDPPEATKGTGKPQRSGTDKEAEKHVSTAEVPRSQSVDMEDAPAIASPDSSRRDGLFGPKIDDCWDEDVDGGPE